MKQITLILASPPYSGQDLDTVIGISEAALQKGHRVAVVGSGRRHLWFPERAAGIRRAQCGKGNFRSHRAWTAGGCLRDMLRLPWTTEGAIHRGSQPGHPEKPFRVTGPYRCSAQRRILDGECHEPGYCDGSPARPLWWVSSGRSIAARQWVALLGFRPIVVLVDDGVYLARADQDPGQSEWLSLGATLEEIIARGLYEKKDSPAEFYVDSDSLRKRGINPEDLVEGLEPIEHEKIANLMASHRLQLIF